VLGAPLRPAVVYPHRDDLIKSRDSNFVLGSVGGGDVSLEINGLPVEVKANGAFLAWLPIPEGTKPVYRLVARRGADSAVVEHEVRTWRSELAKPLTARPNGSPRPPPPSPRLIALGAKSAQPDTDRVIVVRPIPDGTYKWFAIPGTRVERLATENGMTRIRLDGTLDGYVATADVVELPDSSVASPPRRLIGNMSVVPDSEWTDVVFPMREPPPFLVEENHDEIVITMYSTRASTDIIKYGSSDALVSTVTWEPLSNDRVRYVAHLRQSPFGYLVFHDGRSLVLRIRRAPRVNRDHPLQGITIAVDAGHPPVGATGPTGLYEGDATLPISFALKEELERRGARVEMTRTTLAPFELGLRPIIARRLNVHALISIHMNASPDGVNPLVVNGTGTYFFHAHGEPLARAVQAGMVRSMGLPDLGIFYDNLALVRPTWMPSILCEGAYIIVPEQEAAMRSPEGQRAYARGVAAGIEAYFKALGQTQ
jgi:N-acetylmuramoyl-L-alanine amidase